MTDLVALKEANAERWANAKLTRDFSAVAKRLVVPAAKSALPDSFGSHRRALANRRGDPRARMFAKLGRFVGTGEDQSRTRSRSMFPPAEVHSPRGKKPPSMRL